MTEQQIHLPGVSDDEGRLLNRLLEQLAERGRRNRLRASYYDGKRAIRQVGSVIPPQYFNLGLVLGWSAKAVDILARRCNLDGFVWADGDLDSIGWREVWDDNALGTKANGAVVSSLVHGPAFLVNTTGDDDEPAAQIHVQDARSATGDWNHRAWRLDNLLSVQNRDDEGNVTALALYLDGETITAERDSGRWRVDRQQHRWGVPAEMLPYKPDPNRPFGRSRISRPMMSIHDQALRTLIRLEGHADVFSYPELWMLGADPSVLTGDDGQPLPAWQAVMGRIKGIPDDDEAPESLARADVKQFQASSPKPHLDVLEMHAMMFSGETNIPLDSLGFANRENPTSAESYIASREELIADAEGATDDWSPAFRRAMARALAIQNGLGEVPDEWRSIGAQWRSPVHLSRAAQADAGTKQISAVPWLAETRVGLELLGLSDQQIGQALAEKRRASSADLVAALQSRAAQIGQPDVATAEPAQTV